MPMSVTSVPMSAVSGQFTASNTEFEQDPTAVRRARQQQMLLQQQQMHPSVPENDAAAGSSTTGATVSSSGKTQSTPAAAGAASVAAAAGAAAAGAAAMHSSRKPAGTQASPGSRSSDVRFKDQAEIQPAGASAGPTASNGQASKQNQQLLQPLNSRHSQSKQSRQQPAAVSAQQAQPPAAAAAASDSAALQIAGQQLIIEEHRSILLHNNSQQVLMSQDGCVMHLAQHSTARKGSKPVPFVGLIPEPHVISGTGHPYHATHTGNLFPLALNPRGKPYLAPDGKPLLLGSPKVAAPGSTAAIARLGNSGSEQLAGPAGEAAGSSGSFSASASAAAARDGSSPAASGSGVTAAGFPALAADTVLVWPILTRSGKGAPLLGAAGESLGLAATPADFPYLSAAASATVYCAAAAAGGAALAAASSSRRAAGGGASPPVGVVPSAGSATAQTIRKVPSSSSWQGDDAGPPAAAAAAGAVTGSLLAAAGPVLVALDTGEPLLAPDGSRIQLSPNGQGFVSIVSGKRLYASYGQPLALMRHHKTRKERAGQAVQLLEKAAAQGKLTVEVRRISQLLVEQKQSHVLVQVALAGLAVVMGAAWLAALLLLPSCWIGLGGAYGCGVSDARGLAW